MKRTYLHKLAVRASALILTAIIVAISGTSYQTLAQGRQLSLADILIALRSKKAVPEEKNKILADAVKERGITFTLTSEIEKELDNTGAQQPLIAAIREKNPSVTAMAAVQPTVKLPEPVAKPAPPPPDFDFYRAKATEALKANDFDTAMVSLNKAAELKPAAASVYADRGLIHMRKDEYDAAIEQFSKAIELDPNDSLSYFNLATIKEKLGRTDEAIEAFDRSAALTPNDDLAKNAAARLRKVRTDAAAAVAAASAKPAPVETKPAVEPTKIPKMISVGPLNIYATRLVKPAFPNFEKRFGGDITVVAQITLDAEGKVTSIKQLEGPKSMWYATEYAIKNSAFKPVVMEDGKPTSVLGTLTYRFKAQ